MKHKGLLITLTIFLVPLAPAFACDYLYTIIDQSGREISLEEGGTALLRQDETYTLRMEYRENHRNCTVTPEETLYLLDGARWRVNRESQPLVLLEAPRWEESGPRSHRGEFPLLASLVGTWALEVVRSCPRGGYHGVIHLEVQP
ncbi:hypothetical protein AU468_12880 [Alkalispirochaeta sphaeroplastigenens]|uniref:Uncharacterized protein n=1 Tax=Alkalispirochaeta sphaeroplastigenens TaxID=1187066 RepID=A0A2S4JG17_9SPIO|nr:hypothetical protein [Alkalispirochaeta sphaeroplastigenens]POQ98481.1 hypothetical protein AU468_12880 [Alkalispirochaeta sphaeroplastigenens]